ncbi:hypothetical protein Hanom_Chr07g00652781 [Helianthus anomalus]
MKQRKETNRHLVTVVVQLCVNPNTDNRSQARTSKRSEIRRPKKDRGQRPVIMVKRQQEREYRSVDLRDQTVV